MSAGSAPPGEPGRGRVVTFTAESSNLGRTAIVANVAVILAGAGRRVLVVDWSSESATVRVYLDSFHVDGPDVQMAPAATFNELTTGEDAPKQIWHTERFQLPEDLGTIDLIARSVPDEVRGTALPWGEQRAESFFRLREALRRTGHDYVLIDAPTKPTNAGVQAIAHVCDLALVVAAPGRLPAMEAAAAIERLREHAVEGSRVLPLPVEIGQDGPDASLMSVRDVLAGFRSQDEDADVPPIPFHSGMVGEAVLATLAEEPSAPGGLVPAYERLTALITHGAVSSLRPPSPVARRNYRIAMGLDRERSAQAVSLVHAPADRRWADWMRHQLTMSGATVTLINEGEPPTGLVVVIVSPHLRASPWVRWIQAGSAPAPVALAVRVPGEEKAPPPELPVLSLFDRPERRARSLLLNRLGMFPAREPDDGAGFTPRYPGEQRIPEKKSNVLPLPPVDFVGREAELQKLREGLLRAGGRPYVLKGPPGVGKSETAREYIRRFQDDYEVIWWIPARGSSPVRLALAELAGRLEIPAGGNAAEAALAQLRDGSAGPWLLVYDDAVDPEELTGALPVGGPGHVIVTCRGADEGGRTLVPLDAETAVDLLQTQVGQITLRQARQIADAVLGLPLSLRMAGAWVAATTEWLTAQGAARHESAAWAAAEFMARLDARTPGEEATAQAAGCLSVIFGTLASDGLGRLTICLLEMVAWLSPDGISQRVLSAPPLLDRLAEAVEPKDGELLAADSMLLPRMLHTAARFGLAEICWDRGPEIRVHRMIQELVREAQPADRRADRHRRMLLALAAMVPPNVGGGVSEHIETYAELQRHLDPACAEQSRDRTVRRWIVNQTRYLNVTGDLGTWRPALALAERVLAGWRADGLGEDLLTGRLLGQIANLRRALGRYADAFEADDQGLTILRRHGLRGHHWALVGTRGLAADLRGLGRFGRSLAEDQAAYDEFADILGADHRDTNLAGINLAESWYLMGQHKAALDTAERARNSLARQFGPNDWVTLQADRHVGDYQRELGLPEDSRRTLQRTLQQVRKLKRRQDELHAQRSHALTVRELRDATASYHELVQVRDGFAAELGPDHPYTVAAELSVAVDLNLTGEHARAAQTAERCLERFRGALYDTDHPFSALCMLDLSAFLVDAGSPRRAVDLAGQARQSLVDRLGEQHPWTLAAGLHLSRALVSTGDLDQAAGIETNILEDAQELLGPEHPYTRIASNALRDTRSRQDASPPKSPRLVPYLEVPSV